MVASGQWKKERVSPHGNAVSCLKDPSKMKVGIAKGSPNTTISKKSFKSRQASNLAFKLHQVTQVQPTGTGTAVATQPNRILGQGKRRIWVGATQAALQWQAQPCDLPMKLTPPSLEALRGKWVNKLRKSFRAACGDFPPPALAFERWLWNNIASYTQTNQGDTYRTPNDPFLGVHGSTETSYAALVTDLVRSSIPQCKATMFSTL